MTVPQALQIALHHHRAGRLADAETLYRQILAAQPNHTDALHHLGIIAHQAGRDDLAVELIRQAIVLDPGNPSAHSNLSDACRALGRLDEAIAACRRALEIAPGHAAAHHNLGIALRDCGQLDEAIAAFHRALALEPGYPDAHFNLGIALRQQGRLDEAIAAYRRALHLRPDLPDALNNLANALKDQGQLDESIATYRRALQLQPGDPDFHNNLGNALRERRQLDDAIAAYRRALQLKPDYPEAHNNLGLALRERGELDEAIAAYRRALQLQPDHSGMHGNLIFALHFHPDHDTRTIAEEHRRWNRQFGDPLKPFLRPHANDRRPDRRLRIGYVSPDFRDHVVGRFIMPLFLQHDRERFEILCYSGVSRADSITDRLRALAAGWRNTAGISDARLAAMIREDAVDILIDLSLHTRGNRLLAFARQPVPVQVSFAGYPGPVGLETIQYRISDRHLEPDPSAEAGAGEQVHWVESYWCYDPCGLELEINPSPALECGSITFGCLGNFAKVNARVLALWARVLRTVQDSRLLLWGSSGSLRERTLAALRKEGVEERRVEFVGARPRREYMELYHRLDIVLDTFPYNGHTTTLDALWMGTPVVSFAGHTPVSRAGLSQLTSLGLPEWVAHSESEYVIIAERLARDIPRLARLRSTLRHRMETSVLMNAPRFARQVEQAYRKMWQTWCATQSPPS
jgi:protein O-GlcNAc transferase